MTQFVGRQVVLVGRAPDAGPARPSRQELERAELLRRLQDF